MGTSSSGTPAQSVCHMLWLTRPWSRLTPLLQAHLEIAAIQLACNRSIFAAVGRHVRIEQVQRDAAYLSAPDLGTYGPAWVRQLDRERRAVRTVFQAQWQVMEVVVHVDLLLR